MSSSKVVCNIPSVQQIYTLRNYQKGFTIEVVEIQKLESELKLESEGVFLFSYRVGVGSWVSEWNK